MDGEVAARFSALERIDRLSLTPHEQRNTAVINAQVEQRTVVS